MRVAKHTLALGLMGLALAGCPSKSEPSASGTPKAGAAKGGPPAPPPASVQVAIVKTRQVRPTAEYAAQTSARRTVEVKGQVEGILEDFTFAEGSYVTKGQTLFTIDPRSYQAAVRTAEAQIERVRADLTYAERQVNLRRAQADLAQA